ncbi:hypothetical protein XENTR_v10006924 [Xenopus tropicalis]|nr:hypothetical protein XENTR_v10006924 [Xenopus tropicalis]
MSVQLSPEWRPTYHHYSLWKVVYWDIKTTTVFRIIIESVKIPSVSKVLLAFSVGLGPDQNPPGCSLPQHIAGEFQRVLGAPAGG